MQWAFVEQHTCPRYGPNITQTNLNVSPSVEAQYSPSEDPTIPECTVNTSQSASPASPCHALFQSPCSSPKPLHPPQIPNHNSVQHNNLITLPIKRKRSVNPQADENFVRALDAVRFGGIGFCKAARMYGVNNRTLWLEYKKRGYPINRPSIKNRIKTEFTSALDLQPQDGQHRPQPNHPQQAAPDQSTQHSPPPPTHAIICTPPQPLDMVTSAFQNDFTEDMRPRYHESILTAAQINMHPMNFS